MAIIHPHLLKRHKEALGPDYRHLGWTHRGTVVNRGRVELIPDEHLSSSIFTARKGGFGDVLPVFQKTGGNAYVIPDYFQPHESRFFHVPHDQKFATTSWDTELQEFDEGNAHDLTVSAFHVGSGKVPGEWSVNRRSRPAATGSIREMANVLKGHYPGQLMAAERVTGATANKDGKTGAMKVYDPKIVRHLEVLDFARYFDEVFK